MPYSTRNRFALSIVVFDTSLSTKKTSRWSCFGAPLTHTILRPVDAVACTSSARSSMKRALYGNIKSIDRG